MYYQVAPAFGELKSFHLLTEMKRYRFLLEELTDAWPQGSTTEPIKTTSPDLKGFLQHFMDTLMWIILSLCFQPYLFFNISTHYTK